MSTMERSKGRKCVIIFIPLLSILLGSSLALGAPNQGPGKIPEKVFRIQMPFIANEGQIGDEHVRFYATTFAGTVYVSDKGEVVYLFSSSEPRTGKGHLSHGTTKTSVIKEKLLGSSKTLPEGRDKAETKVNYFIGNDKGKWKTDIATYNSVSLGEVYAGVELELKAYGKRVEKIFTVKPGADPKAINLKIAGAKSLNVNDQGELEIITGLREIRYSKPFAYQERNGKRESVQVAYNLNKNTYGFRVSNYDASLPLVIDPVLVYSTFWGGIGYEIGHGIAVDASGNFYVVGTTTSIGGVSDAFVNKYGPNNTLLLSTTLGGNYNDEGYGIALDSSGCVYVTGSTTSTNLPNAVNGKSGGLDAFVTKLSNSGSPIYSRYLGGSGDDAGYAIAVDSANPANVYVTGYTKAQNFPTLNPYKQKNAGYIDVFVTKLDSNLNLLFSTYLGGSSYDYGEGIAADSSGNIYLTGYTNSVNFPTLNGLPQGYAGGYDAFVTKWNITAQCRNAVCTPIGACTNCSIKSPNNDYYTLSYSTFLGGSGDDYGHGIVVDSGGFIYVTGEIAAGTSHDDVFITKIDPNKSGDLSRIYLTYLAGGGDDEAYGIAVDDKGNAYITGYTNSGDLPLASNTYGGGTNDAFIAQFKPDGTILSSTYLGGSNDDKAYGIAFSSIGGIGNIYVTGSTSSSDFPKAANSFGGGTDAFVAKFALSNCPSNYYNPIVPVWVDINGVTHTNEQKDYDQDGVGDVCDNCPSVPNGPLKGTCVSTGAICYSKTQCSDCSLNQEDNVGNGIGDACRNNVIHTVTELDGTLATVCVTYNNVPNPPLQLQTIMPSCKNTVFTCKDQNGNILPPICRLWAFSIPDEVLTLPDPQKYPNNTVCYNCDLAEEYYPEILASAQSLDCTSTHSTYIQDPNTGGGRNNLWMGAAISQEIKIQYVTIDLLPTLNLGNQGVTPVTIFGSPNFSVGDIDVTAPITLTGDKSNTPTDPSCLQHSSISDLNGDGFPDMQLQFSTQNISQNTLCLAGVLTSADTVVTLKGQTYSGSFLGKDTVSIIK